MHGRKFLYNRDVWWETLLKQLSLSKLKGPWIHETTLRYWKTYAEASPLFYDTMSTIHRLKKAGFRIGMVSDSDGTPGMKMKRIRQQPFLKSLEAIVVAGEDTPSVKPSRRPFTLVAERLGLQPRNCVYIGDNPNTDIEGAKGVGMMMILVKRRGSEGGHPDYLARWLSNAAKLLMQNQSVPQQTVFERKLFPIRGPSALGLSSKNLLASRIQRIYGQDPLRP